jgi:DNA-binding GntR family transcriptional regulator
VHELRPISHVRPANLAGRAYDELESAIVRCVLCPEQIVTDRGLAEPLKISRTPVREPRFNGSPRPGWFGSRCGAGC